MAYDPSDERFRHQLIVWLNAVYGMAAERILDRIDAVEKHEVVEPDEVLLLNVAGEIETAWSSPSRPDFLQDGAIEWRRVGVFTYLRSP
jgi:hypothetical protein